MDGLMAIPGTFSASKVTFAAGTTSTYSTTGTTVFCIAGKAYSTAAKSNVATPTVDIVDGLAFAGLIANQGCIFIVGFDTGGTLRAAQGSVESLDVSGNFINLSQLPVIPDTICAVGYLIVKAGSTASTATPWVFGTANLATPATGITLTFGDLLTMPPRPIAS